MSGTQLLYLSAADIDSVDLTIENIINAVETAFREKAEGRTEMPPKLRIHPGGEDNAILAMPAYISALKSAGIKWVGAFMKNPDRGLPSVTGLLILNDPETGIPIAIMDCGWITAVRTGAATAVAARYLARSESSVVGALGCGVQGRSNVEALKALFPINQIMAYDMNQVALNRYCDEMADRLNLDVIPVKNPRDAVTGCDIIVTAGPVSKKPHATIKAGWMDQGAFASLVDLDSYWHPGALHEINKFCTDDTTQMNYYQEQGYFQRIPHIHAEIGELVIGRKPGREDPMERTLTANIGLALGDMAVAPFFYQAAIKKGIGTLLPLWTEEV